MSDTKKTTKIAAVAASLAMVATTGYGISSQNFAAHAEEHVMESQLTSEEMAQCSKCGKQIEANKLLEGKCFDCVTLSGTPLISSELGFALTGEDGETDEGDTDPSGTPDDSEDIVYRAPVITATGIASVEPGSEFTIRMEQQIEPQSAANKLTELQMSLTGPSASGIDVVKVIVKQTGSVLYDSSLSGDAAESTNKGSCEKVANDYIFSFDEDYMTNEFSYDGYNDYTMELVCRVTEDKGILSSFVDNESGNVIIPLDNIKGKSLAARASGPIAPSEEGTINEGTVVNVAVPKLHAVMTTGGKEEGVEHKAQIFDTVTYNVHITNVGNAAAHGIVLEDIQLDPYSTLGIKPVSATLTKNGLEVKIPENAITFDPVSGDITINLPDTIQLSGSDYLDLTYTITAGLESMRDTTAPSNETEEARNARKGKLQELIAMDAGNRSGERKVTVSAANALSSTNVDVAFNLLVPSASSTTTTSLGDDLHLSTGESCQVTTKFTVEGEDGSKLINPKINVTDPVVGRVENFKVNGVPYNRGDIIRDVEKGQVLILTYDVFAPSDYKSEYDAGIQVASVLSADNLVNNTTSQRLNIGLAIPEVGIGIEVNDQTPSAEDNTSDAHPIHVRVTVSEKTGKTELSGTQVIITDIATKEGEEPVARRFENVKFYFGETELTDVHYISTPESGTLTVDCPNIAHGSSIQIEYDDYLNVGPEQNGYSDSISARVQKNSTGASNFPVGQEKSAMTDFTIQVPELHIAQEVTGPVTEVSSDSDEEGEEPTVERIPDVINAGDTVSYKVSFYENNPDMPAAKGRDFVLKSKIEDLFIANKKTKDSTEDKDKTDTMDGRTYKASQLGITFCPIEEIKLMSGEEDVTEKYDIKSNATNSEISVTPKEKLSQDAPEIPTSMEFSVKMGKHDDKNNFDQLSGKDIKVVSEVSVSNLEKSSKAISSTKIADAKLHLTMNVDNKEITHGMTDTYKITAVNDEEDKFDDSSKARNIKIEDDLDEAARKLGYKFDPSSMQVMLGDEDITNTSDVVILWDNDNAGFDLTLSRDLAKNEKLTITYDATTSAIDAQAYSETLGNVIIATADNAKPAVAYQTINYIGVDLPTEGKNNGSSSSDDRNYGGGSLMSTGDVLPYVIGGVIAVAVIGGVVVLVVRRRNQ